MDYSRGVGGEGSDLLHSKENDRGFPSCAAAREIPGLTD